MDQSLDLFVAIVWGNGVVNIEFDFLTVSGSSFLNCTLLCSLSTDVNLKSDLKKSPNSFIRQGQCYPL